MSLPLTPILFAAVKATATVCGALTTYTVVRGAVEDWRELHPKPRRPPAPFASSAAADHTDADSPSFSASGADTASAEPSLPTGDPAETPQARKEIPSPTTTAAGDKAATGPASAPPLSFLARFGRLPWGRYYAISWAVALPLAAVLAQWALLADPARAAAWVPPILSRAAAGVSASAVRLHPSNLREAFELGAVWEAARSGGEAGLAAALARASELAGGRPVSAAELAALPELVESMSDKRSAIDRLRASFTLVNVMWATAIVGLSVTTGPVLYAWLRPFIPLTAISRLALGFGARMITPTLFASSFVLSAEALRCGGGGGGAAAVAEAAGLPSAPSAARATLATSLAAFTLTGPMLALSADAVFFAGLGLCGRVWARYLPPWLWPATVAAFAAPGAILHQSSLLGYPVVAAALAACGFVAETNGLFTVLGFDSRAALLRVAAVCGTGVAAFAGLSASGAVDPAALRPFRSAVGTLGGSVYLLSLNILSLIEPTAGHLLLHTGSLAAMVAAGELLPYKPLSYAGQAYTGFFLFTAYSYFGYQRTQRNHRLQLTFFFTLFAGMYGAALGLSRHPELVSALIRGVAPPV